MSDEKPIQNGLYIARIAGELVIMTAPRDFDPFPLSRVGRAHALNAGRCTRTNRTTCILARSRLASAGRITGPLAVGELHASPHLCHSCHSGAPQHSLAPDEQTTGDTTPLQQIVYADWLTTSGERNA